MDITNNLTAINNMHRGTPIFIHGESLPQCELAFRENVINYITKNPKSPKQWKKLIQTCKLFFDKNPIVVIPCLHFRFLKKFTGTNCIRCKIAYSLRKRELVKIVKISVTGEEWKTCSSGVCDNQGDKTIEFYGRPFKLWITENLIVWASSFTRAPLSTKLIPQLFKCDATKIRLYNNILSLDELSFLTSNIVDALFSSMRNTNRNDYAFEEIMEILPASLEKIDLTLTSDNFTPVTFEKLAKMEHVRKLKKMVLYISDEAEPPFNFDALFKFVLENKQIWFDIEIDGSYTAAEMTTIHAAAKRIRNEDYGIHQRPNICYDHDTLL